MGKKRSGGFLMQDIGLVLLLCCMGGMAFTVANASKGQMLEYLFMMLLTFFAILLAGFKLNSISVVVAGISIIGYTAYKLYFYFSYDEGIDSLSFVWIVLPILSVASMILFVYGNHKTEIENEMLQKQVDRLVMIHPVTGLYNLRSLYHDLHIQISYAKRNQIPFCFMMIQLRYERELRSILSRTNYETLQQKIAEIVSDTLRVEDRIYSIDDKGSIGIILICDGPGSDYVKNRIQAKLEEKDTFKGITDTAIKVDVRMACLEYKEELYGTNVMEFKQKVESELQYDV